MSHPNSSIDDEIDLYAVLKCDRSASFEAIQRSFKRLSRNFHPDKRRSADDKTSAEDFFVAIKLAHDILSDPVLRLAYDHGGLVAVDILRRSHLSASQQQSDDEEMANQQNQNDDNEEDNENLYHKLQNMKSKEEAIKFIHELVETYNIQRSIMHKAPIGMEAELVHIYDPQRNILHSRGLGSLNVQAQRSFFLSKHMDISVSAQSQVQRRPQQQGLVTARTTSLGFSYRTDAASHHFLNCSLNQGNPQHSQISLQTTRRFYGGNMFSLAVGGSLLSIQPSTWIYSISTNRIIMLGSLLPWTRKNDDSHQPKQHQEPTKVHVSWSLGMSLLGQIQSIAGSIRNLTYPQYKFRLGLLDSPPIKITADSSEEDCWHAALSLDWNWWRIKVTKEHSILDNGNWTLRYGIKYDVRGAKIGRAWSILLHLESSDDWHLRIPIIIQQMRLESLEWPVVGTVVLLLCEWAQESFPNYFSSWVVSRSNSSFSWATTPSSKQELSRTNNIPSYHVYYTDMISRIAAKKRELESKNNGLVILQAVWYNTNTTANLSRSRSDDDDLTDVLQYWVVDGHLNLPIQQCRWQWFSSHDERTGSGDRSDWSVFREPTSNGSRSVGSQWWPWIQDWLRSQQTVLGTLFLFGNDQQAVSGCLYVRYRLGSLVHEIRFYDHQRYELVCLPNDLATVMGAASQVE